MLKTLLIGMSLLLSLTKQIMKSCLTSKIMALKTFFGDNEQTKKPLVHLNIFY